MFSVSLSSSKYCIIFACNLFTSAYLEKDPAVIVKTFSICLIEEIFYFSYSCEVYTPAAKRKFGYYVLPVLYKNKFVARFDPEPNRGKNPLQIKNWWWEPAVEINDQMLTALENAFKRFCKFLDVEMMEENHWKAKLGIS